MKISQIFMISILVLAIAVPNLAISHLSPALQVAEDQIEVEYWAGNQTCSYPISDSDFSVDGSVNGFDNQAAACFGDFVRDQGFWVFSDFGEATLSHVSSVSLEIAFSLGGWSGERLRLQVSQRHAENWQTLETFDHNQPPPESLRRLIFDLNEISNLSQWLSAPKVRLVAAPTGAGGSTSPFTLQVDAVRLLVSGWTEISATATHRPAATRTIAPSVTATGTGNDPPTQTPVRTRTQEAPNSPTPQEITPDFTHTATNLPFSTPTPSPTATGTPGVSLPTPDQVPNEPIPTSTLPSLDPTDIPSAGNPHTNLETLTDRCAACHRSHLSAGPELRSAWPEENVCFQCHGAEGPGTPVEQVFMNLVNTETRIFKHDVYWQAGIHTAGENDGAALGGGSRHGECEDCHDPHNTARGETAAPAVQWEMSGAAGVEPFWTDEGPPDFYGWLPTVQREYQVCLKCHSSFTELPDYAPDGWNGETYVADGLAKLTHLNPDQVLDSRDLAREFNPYNASFHPVITIGRNQMIPSESFVLGWSVDSIAYCTDCHDNPVNSDGGPHGSPRLHLLDGGAEYQTLVREGTPPSPEMICFKCHAAEVYLDLDNPSTNFFRTHGSGRNLHGVHMAWGATCYACHDSHGSEQEHLLNFNLADDIHPTAGYNSQTAWFAVEEQSGCALVCHGKMHNGHVSQMYRYP